jgi:hypothetical protein
MHGRLARPRGWEREGKPFSLREKGWDEGNTSFRYAF